MGISGAIITFNEEQNIAEVLNSLDFCDEIIVVDSFSTDKTKAIATAFPKVKFFENEFEDYTKQRNLALHLAKNDWILFLDADERLTPALKTEILSAVRNPTACAYYFRRKFFFEGRPINFSGTQKDKNFRLFRKSKAHYQEDKKVHETLSVEGAIGILKNKLLHYSVKDTLSYRAKMLKYGDLKGQELAKKGKKYSYTIKWGKTVFKFFKCYILGLGILDGRDGLTLSYLQSLSVAETYNALKKYQS